MGADSEVYLLRIFGIAIVGIVAYMSGYSRGRYHFLLTPSRPRDPKLEADEAPPVALDAGNQEEKKVQPGGPRAP